MEHPEFCYNNDFRNNCTIIKWGEGGYYKTDYPEGHYDKSMIKELNARMGVTPEQANAMVICSMVAQENPNLDWDAHYSMIMERSTK